MSGDREALAKLIAPWGWATDNTMAREVAFAAADRILAAGWRPSQPAPADDEDAGVAEIRRHYWGEGKAATSMAYLLAVLDAERAAREAAERALEDKADLGWWGRFAAYLSKRRREAVERAAAAEAEVARLRDKADNLLIAIGMGWDLDGVVAEMRAALAPAAPEAADGR